MNTVNITRPLGNLISHTRKCVGRVKTVFISCDKGKLYAGFTENPPYYS